MKKLFLLIPALVLAIAANAAVIDITPTSPYDDQDNLRLALYYAADGDEIIMAEGTYVESPSNYIAFASKSIVVRAADGANVIVKPQVPITLSGGARAEIRGIKIDASELCSVNSYSHLMYPSDDADNNRLILDGCEIYGYAEGKAIIASRSSNKLDSLIINNCKFYNHTTRSCVFLENTANIGLIVKNSTFCNIATGTEEFGAGIIDDRSTTAKVRVDHCTFYNVEVKNTDYAAIGQIKTTDAIVSNCIFMMPSAVDGVRAIRDVAQANNCLTFNYLKDSGKGIHSSVTQNNCIFADPLFTDAANGDYTFAGNWETMQLSPARGAATDGSDLGDPRWYSAEVLPSTDFASDYVFLGTKAQLSGSFALNGDNYIQSQDKTYAGIAKWKIHADRGCIVEVTLNIAADNTSGHRYEVALYDADNVLVGTALAEPSNSWSAGDKVLGTFTIPAAGNYTVKLTNDCDNSSTIIEGVKFAYIGGAVQAMPGTTDINEAWFSGATRADGKITFPSGKHDVAWVKWNVSFASAAYYQVTVNVNNTAGHNFTAALYRSESDVSPITLSEGETKYSSGTPNTINLGAMYVPAGDYILKITDAVAYSNAELISVVFTYSGGNVVDIASAVNTALPVADAWFTSSCVRADGQIEYHEDNANAWIKWNIAATASAFYDITVNINTENAHQFAVNIYEDENEAPVASVAEPGYTTSKGTPIALELGRLSLVAGKNYVVKVTNITSGSQAKLIDVVFAPVVSSSTTLPNTLALGDAVLVGTAFVDDGKLYFAEYDHEGHIADQDANGAWAVWNVEVEADGTFLFTLNTHSENGQSYRISILDGEENIVDSYEKNPGEGDGQLKHYFYLPAGNYSVKVQNMTNFSHGYLTSFVVTAPEMVVLSETATDNSAWADKIVTDPEASTPAFTVQIRRTFKAGMYNTLCLPFACGSTKLKEIFGSDVVWKYLNSAEFDESESILDLEFVDAPDIYPGTPYLIKPSKDIVYPVFENVVFRRETPASTTRNRANFVGTFTATEIPAGEENLFLGPNDLLYFSQNATPVKGFRAWFVLHDAPAGVTIRRARIIEPDKLPTDIQIVDGEIYPLHEVLKIIENGQLIIVRDGLRYNAMGVRLQ